MGKSSVNGPFSIAMFVYQRVIVCTSYPQACQKAVWIGHDLFHYGISSATSQRLQQACVAFCHFMFLFVFCRDSFLIFFARCDVCSAIEQRVSCLPGWHALLPAPGMRQRGYSFSGFSSWLAGFFFRWKWSSEKYLHHFQTHISG